MDTLTSYELQDQIATIKMDDGKVNALSIAMLQSLHEAFEEAEREKAIVILTGREGYLSAGFDLKVFARGGDVLEMLTLGATLFERMLSFPTPVVVACSGHAVAAGAFLPLAADVRIGADGTFQIGLNEVRIGMTVPWFGIELARQRLHPAHFDRALNTARMYQPREAVDAGFLDEIVAPGDLRAASLGAAAALSELNPAAHAATKLRVRAGALQAMRAAIESELTTQGLTST